MKPTIPKLITESDREHFRKEDEERERHYAGDCDSYCWLCEEARELGEDAIGG